MTPIGPPLRDCPACGRARTFGVWPRLPGDSDEYLRECRACGHRALVSLPPIRRAILYLDQPFLSEVMKAQDPRRSRTARDQRTAEFWLGAFDRLLRATILQAVGCPRSSYHLEEAIPMGQEPWRGLDELSARLAADLTFRSAKEIQTAQLRRCASAWASGTIPQDTVSTRHEAIAGRLDGWCSTIETSVGLTWPSEVYQELGLISQARRSKLETLWKTCAAARETFEETYRVEVDGFRGRLLTGSAPTDTARFGWLRAISDGLADAGVSAANAPQKTAEFICSEGLETVPFLRVFCLT